MFSKFLKLIKRALVRGGNGNLVPKISGRNPIEIFRNMKWLGVRQKSAISKATLQTVWKNDDIRKEVNRILLKDFFNKRLSKEERDILSIYEKFSDDPKTKTETQYVKSSWIIWAEYHKPTKQVKVNMVRGKTIYTFYNVPRTKWLALRDIGGKFMWDWFGKHYSTNPQNWIRTGGIR